MGKVSPVSAKYIVHALMHIDGSVDRPDIIGAIFGQTEGFLGNDLELRELQRSGKIGRIEVKSDVQNGKTISKIIIPCSLDKAETAIIAAALETIERIGPCNSNSKIEKIRDQYIFSLRRLDPSKGIDTLIKAFNIIKNKFPKLYLVIAGEGAEEKKLKMLVDNYSLNDRVIFIGTVGLGRGISLLKGASLTVVPSLSEGGGLVNIEAQAAGCPVIASRVGGIPEYVKDGESGILFEPGNYDELAEKISQLLSNSSLREKLINGGIKYAKNFDWNILAPQYIKSYERAIKNYNTDLLFKPWSDLTNEIWNKLTK